jgi:hypothetical protein
VTKTCATPTRGRSRSKGSLPLWLRVRVDRLYARRESDVASPTWHAWVRLVGHRSGLRRPTEHHYVRFTAHCCHSFIPTDWPLRVASRPPSKAHAALCPETPSHLTRPRAERIFRIAGRQRLKGECLAALLRADGDAVRACAHTRRLDPCSGPPRLFRHLLWIPLDVGILRGGHGGPLSTGVPNRRNARNGTVGTCPECAT